MLRWSLDTFPPASSFSFSLLRSHDGEITKRTWHEKLKTYTKHCHCQLHRCRLSDRDTMGKEKKCGMPGKFPMCVLCGKYFTRQEKFSAFFQLTILSTHWKADQISQQLDISNETDEWKFALFQRDGQCWRVLCNFTSHTQHKGSSAYAQRKTFLLMSSDRRVGKLLKSIVWKEGKARQSGNEMTVDKSFSSVRKTFQAIHSPFSLLSWQIVCVGRNEKIATQRERDERGKPLENVSHAKQFSPGL